MTKLKDGYIAMFGKDWYEVLEDFITQPVFFNIANNLKRKRSTTKVIPDSKLVFRAFRETGYYQTKVVIIGDYNTNGLAFCCANRLTNTIEVDNFLKEIDRTYPERKNNIDFDNIDRGDLSRWARQGVLLFSVALTMDTKPHYEYWKPFIEEVLKKLNERYNLIFVFMGKETHKFKDLISQYNMIIPCPHPSTDEFVGSRVFVEINERLNALNKKEIVW